MVKDYYKILGVPRNATKEEIKRAYKRLAKKYHPDLNKDPKAAEKFKEINEAVSVLADDEKRAQYDKYGTVGEDMGFGFDFSEFMSNIADFGFDFDKIFERFFGGGFERETKGADLRYDLYITLEESAFGVTKHIKIPRLEKCERCNGTGAKTSDDIVTCPECNGTGFSRRVRRTPFGIISTTTTCRKCRGSGKYIQKECEECDGTGVVKKIRRIEVKIPAGAEEGTKLRISGMGEAGQKGLPPGDLYIVIHIKKHSIFERKGNDVYVEVPIPFTIAALGGEIEVPTLEGKAILKIPPGTQYGTLFRMKNKGIPYLHGSGRGSQYVRVIIEIPKRLTKKQKKLLKEFGEAGKGWFKPFS